MDSHHFDQDKVNFIAYLAQIFLHVNTVNQSQLFACICVNQIQFHSHILFSVYESSFMLPALRTLLVIYIAVLFESCLALCKVESWL